MSSVTHDIEEPYIATKGSEAGKIITVYREEQYKTWIKEYGGVPFVEWERARLAELEGLISIELGLGYALVKAGGVKYESRGLTRYTYEKYCADTWTGRLIARGEFLRAVCEREGVEWLPAACQAHGDALERLDSGPWRCSACKEKIDPDAEKKRPDFCGHCNGGHKPGACLPSPAARDTYTKAEVDEEINRAIRHMFAYVDAKEADRKRRKR